MLIEKRSKRIEAILVEALQPHELTIRDESAKHASHAAKKGIQGEETHLFIYIKSAQFDGLTRLARSRLVHRLLADELNSGLHALSLSLEPSESLK